MLTALWNRIATTFRPDKLYIDPEIDFDASTETLRIRISAELKDRRLRLSKEAIRKGRGTVDGRRFRIDKRERQELLDATPGCEWIDNWVLVCPKEHIPSCLSKLRCMGVRQAPNVKSIQIHDTPLEPRVFMELKDPETLIVRQQLTTPSGQAIPIPDIAAFRLMVTRR